MHLTYKNIFRATAYSLLPWFVVACSFASDGDADRSTIRVLTYNVQFLPGLASTRNKRPNPVYRAVRIAEEASRYDLVGLPETFHPTHRDLIVGTLDKLWEGVLSTVVSPKPKSFFTNGGCLIATRMPIVSHDSVVYKHFSQPKDYGLRADGFAAKGVIHARVARAEDSPEDFIDVFVTHLEARDDQLRPLQYAEMAAFIKTSSDPRRPTLVMGDMNTQGAKEFRTDPKSQYRQLVEQLKTARPESKLIDVWPFLKGDALGGTNKQESHKIGKRIDYLFIMNPSEPHAQLNPTAAEVRLFRDPKVFALSDHNAVETELEWSFPSKVNPSR